LVAWSQNTAANRLIVHAASGSLAEGGMSADDSMQVPWLSGSAPNAGPPSPMDGSRLAETLFLVRNGGVVQYYQTPSLEVQFNAYLNGGVQAWSQVAQALGSTGIAALAWNDGLSVRNYYQGMNGTIYQAADWGKPPEPVWQSTAIIPDALPNTGLAAVAWENGNEIRIYYQNEYSAFCEADSSAGWVSTSLPAPNVLSKTSIAAIAWGNGNYLRVYYQSDTGQIYQLPYNKGWTTAAVVQQAGIATNNTGIAAITWAGTNPSNAQIRLYYQTPGHILQELCYMGTGSNWTAGSLNTLNIAASPMTPLCAVTWEGGGTINIRLSYFDTDGNLTTAIFNGVWSAGAAVTTK
jgi:hypothetical protein